MTDDELRRLLDANAERIEKRFEKRFDATDKRIDGLDKKFDEKTAELSHQFAATAEDFRDKFNLLAEGIANAEEKSERRDAEIQLSIDDTHATIKLSHASLDRQIRTLEHTFEEKVSGLQVRVERLEENKGTY